MSLLNFLIELICQTVENYMKTKTKTTPTTHMKSPLLHVGQHLPKQCLNDTGD